jgi:hypothetical protein
MIIPRRGFLLGLASLIAAPAIVRIENIMPVRVFTDVGTYSGPPLELISPLGEREQLQVMDWVLTHDTREIVGKIMASQLVYVR